MDQLHRFCWVDPAPLCTQVVHELVQIPARNELHDDVEQTVGSSKVKDTHNARVIQPRRRARLLQKSLAKISLLGQAFMLYLERNFHLKNSILRLVYAPHATFAQEI